MKIFVVAVLCFILTLGNATPVQKVTLEDVDGVAAVDAGAAHARVARSFGYPGYGGFPGGYGGYPGVYGGYPGYGVYPGYGGYPGGLGGGYGGGFAGARAQASASSSSFGSGSGDGFFG